MINERELEKLLMEEYMPRTDHIYWGILWSDEYVVDYSRRNGSPMGIISCFIPDKSVNGKVTGKDLDRINSKRNKLQFLKPVLYKFFWADEMYTIDYANRIGMDVGNNAGREICGIAITYFIYR